MCAAPDRFWRTRCYVTRFQISRLRKSTTVWGAVVPTVRCKQMICQFATHFRLVWFSFVRHFVSALCTCAAIYFTNYCVFHDDKLIYTTEYNSRTVQGKFFGRRRDDTGPFSREIQLNMSADCMCSFTTEFHVSQDCSLKR